MKKYFRSEDIGYKLNKFLCRLTGTTEDYYSRLTQEDLVQLKIALANINNALTLRTTLAFADWLSNTFKLNTQENADLLHQVESVKPNTNGYDIELPQIKVIAEIKSIVPINGGNYYGAAQRNSILDDVIKLFRGKKRISDTSGYIKFLGILDLGHQTDQAIDKLLTPATIIRTEHSSRLDRHEAVKKLEVIPSNFKISELSTEKVYIKKICI